MGPECEGQKTAKIAMQNGRTLTTLERHGWQVVVRYDLGSRHRDLVLIRKELDREHPVGRLGEDHL